VAEPTVDLWCWRHPRARGAAGRCIGRTDLAVDARKAKRLAHRIRACARRSGLPRAVWCSPLGRALAVGRWLRGWGFTLHVDARLAELDFGRWDGRAWSQIAHHEVEAWQHDLLHHAPGGGESLAALALRVRAFVQEAPGARLVVTHGGWLNALLHVLPAGTALDATRWPAPPAHGALVRWPQR
jgi:alpha-ribazole phosphatase